MNISFIMACTCGAEIECEREDQEIGRVWQCPACGEITARITTRDGRRIWVPLDAERLTQPYYDILGTHRASDEEEEDPNAPTD